MVEKCIKCLHQRVCGIKEDFEEMIKVVEENDNESFKITVDCLEYTYSRAKKAQASKEDDSNE